MEKSAKHDFIFSYLRKSNSLLSLANTVYRTAEEGEKADIDRESKYMDRNIARTKKSAFIKQQNFSASADKLILMELLRKASKLPKEQRIKNLDQIFALDQDEANWIRIIDVAYSATRLSNKESLEDLLSKSLEEIKNSEDPILKWISSLQPQIKEARGLAEARSGKLSKLSAQWSEVKQLFEKSHFIPDANGTFRLTLGRIRGYAPQDAVFKYPITTVSGILEKHTGHHPFNAPDRLRYLIEEKNFGNLASKKLNNMPVGLLYDCDTTGGNSGSPVLNAKGELVGLNFDRTFEATINDFAWDQSYSRSIGVDIRYILWVIQKFAGADYLLEEMGIQLN